MLWSGCSRAAAFGIAKLPALLAVVTMAAWFLLGWRLLGWHCGAGP